MIFSVTYRIKVNNDINRFLVLLDKKFTFLFCNQIYDEYIIDGPITDEQIVELENFFSEEIRVMNQQGTVTYIYVKCRNQDKDHLVEAKTLTLMYQSILMSVFQIANWQQYTVIIFEKENLKKLYADLKDNFESLVISEKIIPLLDFTSYNPVEIKHILDTITEGQLTILKRCVEEGYYDIPRKIYLQDIAKDLNKSRSSVEKVFRAIENRIMDVIVPQLYFYLTDLNKDSALL